MINRCRWTDYVQKGKRCVKRLGQSMLMGPIAQAGAHHSASATLAGTQDYAKEIERLRAELAVSDARVESLTWVLRIVRRQVNWEPDSPTLRLVEQSIAGAQPPNHVERVRTGPKLRSV